MNEAPILVTSPLLPPLEDFIPYLEDIWKSKYITNNGVYHQKLEKALCEYLEIPYLSLFTNGTLPLITAFHALQIKGEVITTPFSFVATTHALWWNDIKPVFVDVDPLTGNIDPDKIEAAITTKTIAVMPVHVYGNPCNVSKIKKIADTYNLKVIYDAAHAFGVQVDGRSILEYGDMSTLSFHATKVYNTIEGGALVCHSAEDKQRIDYFKNFGFVDEVTVVVPGINSKMDEIRAAYGLLNLKQVDDAIKSRQRTAQLYREGLRDVPGIRFIDDIEGTRHNYSYFPIFVDKNVYRMSRDDLYTKLKGKNIYGRRYFYPLISTFSPYRSLESAAESNLPIAHQLAASVICLPMSAGLPDDDVERVIENIKK